MPTVRPRWMIALGAALGGCGVDTAAPVACQDTPEHAPGVRSSSASSVSHAAGQDCLGCHVAGGAARTVFLVAGTIYGSGLARTVASAGRVVEDVGQTTLTVDTCGNIYAAGSYLNGALAASQPRVGPNVMTISTNQPTRRMGSCNAAGCHDFVEAWGVHY